MRIVRWIPLLLWAKNEVGKDTIIIAFLLPDPSSFFQKDSKKVLKAPEALGIASKIVKEHINLFMELTSHFTINFQ